jgi:hypothetical protein
VFQGLAANSSITKLALHKLQPGQVLQLAAALAAPGACGGRLQQLHLLGARWEHWLRNKLDSEVVGCGWMWLDVMLHMQCSIVKSHLDQLSSPTGSSS